MPYKSFIRPILFKKDPERTHDAMSRRLHSLSKSAVAKNLLKFLFSFQHKKLGIHFAGLRFENPVGLAAGFDKNAQVFPIMPSFGFGFVEIGTITGQAQHGNPKPRLFRLDKDEALINRFGFNSFGAEKISQILQKTKKPSFPLGINIGKTKIVPMENAVDDYLFSFGLLFPYADYVVVNVSSPNTPNLRALQDKDKLLVLMQKIQEKNHELAEKQGVWSKPLFVKIAPDLTFEQIDDVLSVIRETNCMGVIATNTTITRENLKTNIKEDGGLSGKPVRKKSTDIIKYIYEKTHGTLPIMGVGGIFTAQDAYSKIKAGATLVQVYTGFVYEGPSTVKKINKGLVCLLNKDGIHSLQDAVGLDHKRNILFTILCFPKSRNNLLSHFLDAIKKIDRIIASAPSGIPLAACLAFLSQKPMAYVRTKAKSHGKQNQVEGVIIEHSKVACVADHESLPLMQDVVKEKNCVCQTNIFVDAPFDFRNKNIENLKKINLPMQEISPEHIAEVLLDLKAVTLNVRQPYTYASGIRSPIYCDNRLLISHPQEWRVIITTMLSVVKRLGPFDVIAGTSTAGIPHAAVLSLILSLPLVYVKDTEITGFLKKGQRVLVVEDLVSTGQSSIQVVKTLREYGVIVEHCLAIFTYNFPQAIKSFEETQCQLNTLCNFDNLIEKAEEKNYLSPKEKIIALRWNKNPERWKP